MTPRSEFQFRETEPVSYTHLDVYKRQALFASFILIGCAWAAMLALPFTILTNALTGGHMGTYLGLFNGCLLYTSQFWYQEAMKKLPILTQATSMPVSYTHLTSMFTSGATLPGLVNIFSTIPPKEAATICGTQIVPLNNPR